MLIRRFVNACSGLSWLSIEFNNHGDRPQRGPPLCWRALMVCELLQPGNRQFYIQNHLQISQTLEAPVTYHIIWLI